MWDSDWFQVTCCWSGARAGSVRHALSHGWAIEREEPVFQLLPVYTCLPFLSLSHTYYTFRHTPSLSYTVPDMLSKGRERKGCLLSMRVAPRQTCWCTVACLFSTQLYCQWGIHSRQVGCRLAKWGISVVRVYLHEVNLCHHRPS